MRAENGFNQDLKIFGVGLRDYLSTEEGLTSYFEEKTGLSNLEVMRSYAGRVLAVDCLCSGKSFRETFDFLRTYFDDENAWKLCVRVFRGGGFTKDYVYLKGYFEVKDFIESGENVRDLYVGKIGLKDLEFVEKLVEEGVLKKAKFLPEFLYFQY